MRYFVFLLLIGACASPEKESPGSFERLDPRLDEILSPEATLEIISEGYEWSEGPVWVEHENMLLFSDVPMNTVYKWTEQGGTQVYLKPSGFTGDSTTSREPGSNGLLLYHDSLILCQHGDRRVAKMEANLANPKSEFKTWAATYKGKRLSSPNDAALRNNGDIFFTDPPYGLGQQNEDPQKELPFNGVYKVTPAGVVTLLVDTLTRPNGIILMPGNNKLIVANSDPAKAMWYEYELNDQDSIMQGRVFYNATGNLATENGLPDGLKVDSQGTIFASGPGGIWIFDSTGKVLGRIRLTELAANCALSTDEKTLYITADRYVLRVKLRK